MNVILTIGFISFRAQFLHLFVSLRLSYLYSLFLPSSTHLLSIQALVFVAFEPHVGHYGECLVTSPRIATRHRFPCPVYFNLLSKVRSKVNFAPDPVQCPVYGVHWSKVNCITHWYKKRSSCGWALQSSENVFEAVGVMSIEVREEGIVTRVTNLPVVSLAVERIGIWYGGAKKAPLLGRALTAAENAAEKAVQVAQPFVSRLPSKDSETYDVMYLPLTFPVFQLLAWIRFFAVNWIPWKRDFL